MSGSRVWSFSARAEHQSYDGDRRDLIRFAKVNSVISYYILYTSLIFLNNQQSDYNELNCYGFSRENKFHIRRPRSQNGREPLYGLFIGREVKFIYNYYTPKTRRYPNESKGVRFTINYTAVVRQKTINALVFEVLSSRFIIKKY